MPYNHYIDIVNNFIFCRTKELLNESTDDDYDDILDLSNVGVKERLRKSQDARRYANGNFTLPKAYIQQKKKFIKLFI